MSVGSSQTICSSKVREPWVPLMSAAIFFPWAKKLWWVWNRICPRFSLFVFLLLGPLSAVGCFGASFDVAVFQRCDRRPKRIDPDALWTGLWCRDLYIKKRDRHEGAGLKRAASEPGEFTVKEYTLKQMRWPVLLLYSTYWSYETIFPLKIIEPSVVNDWCCKVEV